MAKRTEGRDPRVVAGFFESLASFNEQPATNVTDRRAINWRRDADYGPFDEVLIEFTTREGRIGYCTKITDVLFYDASAGTYYNLLKAGTVERAMLYQGEDDSATGQFALAQSTDRLLVGTMRRPGGFEFVIDASILNNNASTMTFQHSSTVGFTTTAVSDNTKSTGIFEQAGIVEITAVPADGIWISKPLHKLQGIGHPDAAKKATSGLPRYWSSFASDNLTDAIEIEQIRTLLVTVADGVSDAQANKFKLITEYTIDIDQEQVGSLEIWGTTDNTGDLELNWFKYS